jgi:hypothetical protein
MWAMATATRVADDEGVRERDGLAAATATSTATAMAAFFTAWERPRGGVSRSWVGSGRIRW